MSHKWCSRTRGGVGGCGQRVSEQVVKIWQLNTRWRGQRGSEQLIFRLHFFAVILATTAAFDENNHKNAIFLSHICSRSEKLRIFTQKCGFTTSKKISKANKSGGWVRSSPKRTTEWFAFEKKRTIVGGWWGEVKNFPLFANIICVTSVSLRVSISLRFKYVSNSLRRQIEPT